MSPKSLLAGTGGVLLVVLAAIIFCGFRSRIGTEQSLVLALAREAALRTQIRHLQQSIAASETDRSNLAGIAASLRSNPPSPAKNSAPKRLADLLSKNPELQALYLNAQKASYARTYGPLFQKLGLSPEQIARFEDIMGERDAKKMDLEATAQAQGLPMSDPAVEALMTQAADQAQGDLRGLLGDSGASQLKDYDRAVPVRALVSQFAGAVAFTAPLSQEQAEQLTAALANADSRYQTGGTANFNRVDWTAADQQAQAILTPAQFVTWQQAEPMGGGPSRWMAQFSRAIRQAQ